MKYAKKPVVINAIQWKGTNFQEVQAFIKCKYDRLGKTILIKTLEGVMKCDIHDYIIQGVNGEFYPCKPDIFNKTYEVVK